MKRYEVCKNLKRWPRATYESSAVATLQPSSQIKQSGRPVQEPCWCQQNETTLKILGGHTSCDHRLYSECNARLHSETVPSGNMKHVWVHVHVCANAMASKSLHNLVKQKEFIECMKKQTSSNGTDPKPVFFGARCYNMPNYIEWNTGAASCKKYH
jgi:hypothetical protein